MSSFPYRKSHCGDKTVVRSSYLHNGISYTVRWHLYIDSAPRSPMQYIFSYSLYTMLNIYICNPFIKLFNRGFWQPRDQPYRNFVIGSECIFIYFNKNRFDFRLNVCQIIMVANGISSRIWRLRGILLSRLTFLQHLIVLLLIYKDHINLIDFTRPCFWYTDHREIIF